ncbi:MAG TPA: AsmA-like C-terminal domain-containing protein [Geminicoccaceae bacterium]|nr:AsmA-like C-terminal domain-containing protein [Geminicoccaceae bacterium]
MTSGALRILGTAAALAMTGLVLAAALIVWLLAHGPLPLDALIPYVQQSLDDRFERFEVEIGRASLAWNRETFGPELVLDQFVLLDSTGAAALAVPHTMLRLDGSALLRGAIAPKEIRLSGLRLTLLRRADGSIAIGLGAPAETATEPPLDTGQLVRELDAAAGPGGALQSIEVEITAVILRDVATGQRVEARDGTLRLARSGPDAFAARLAFTLGQSAPLGQVVVSGDHTEAAGWRRLEVAFDDVVPAVLAPLAVALPLARLDFPLSGRLGLPDGRTPRLWPMDVAIEARDFTLAWPEALAQPVEVEHLTAQGRLDGEARSARIDHASVAGAGSSLTLRGTAAGWGGPLTADLTAEVTSLSAARLVAFWPGGVAPAARDWVARNLTAGTIPQGRVEIRLAGQAADAPLPPEAIAGSFAFEGVGVRFLETMPEAADLRGEATLDGSSLRFKIASGTIGEVAIRGGGVAISQGDDEGVGLTVDGEVEASVPAALALLDSPPLEVAQLLKLEPVRTAGRMTASVQIGLPLREGVAAGDVQYVATARASAADLPDLLGGDLDLTGVDATFTATPAGVDVIGKGRVNGVPFELQGRDSFVATGGERRRFEAKGTLDAAGAAALGVSVPSAIGGTAAVELTVVVPDQGPGRYRLVADLGATSVAAGPLGWRKAAGEPGRLTAEAQATPDRLEVTSFALEAPVLTARGNALATGRPLRLDRLALDRLEFVGSELRADLRRAGESYAVEIDARLLDLRPALREPWQESGGSAELPELGVTLKADRLRLADDPITDLRLGGHYRSGRWRDVTLTGTLAAGGRVEGGIDDTGLGVRLTSDDAGGLLDALYHGEGRLLGGRLDLGATLGAEAPAAGAEGRLRLRNFTAERLPTLARIASLMSLKGIANALEGKGVPFELLEIPFRLDGPTARIEKARLVGSELGLTAQGTVDLATRRLDLDGTVVPAYTVNRVLGQIPILGWLMRGQQAEGAFAATYTATGSLDAPEIRVNPLAALVPGFIRDLFSNFGEEIGRGAAGGGR